MDKQIHWGIIGCGGIASKFAADIPRAKRMNSTRHVLAAVASRDEGKASAFRDAFNAARSYSGSSAYSDLLSDPDVDIVYIAVPHNLHARISMEALAAGKPVLCEKPVSVNAREFDDVCAKAEDTGLFFMEGFWTRFFPAISALLEILPSLGSLRRIRADFCSLLPRNPRERWLNPELAGGALLDIGIYPIGFTHIVTGRNPDRLISHAVIGSTGVDETGIVLMEYGRSGDSPLISCGSFSFLDNSPHEALVVGEKGWIRVPDFFHPSRLEGEIDSVPFTRDFPVEGTGFQYEISHVGDCLAKGLLESPLHSLQDSRDLLHTMDSLRQEWGLRYPGEN